ncbi:hypothetical protein [Pedobacter sp. B4-66]|uniref:hypothetical protein n=1 Tax=Pedobacter sp. B4-66 TaxID=2817280 RepID=UPI001BDB6867|nr:hypothetical protein [Pedobacter sp. B4-66]
MKEQEWILLDGNPPEEGEELVLLQKDGNVIDCEGIFYIGFRTPIGYQFVNDDISNPIYYLDVTHYKYRHGELTNNE